MANDPDLLNKKIFGIILVISQVVFIILFAATTVYEFTPISLQPNQSVNAESAKESADHIKKYYPMFQDVHVMIFIGFGFLMTFLKKYGYSAVGLNFLLAAFILQWGSLVFGYLNQKNELGKIAINVDTLINADFTAGTILISFGAVLGKTTPLQLLIMAIFEVVLAKINEYIGLHMLKVTDVGGSMFIHTFGAYFGLAVAGVLFTNQVHQSNKEGATVSSDLFSMIGTVFLWMFWPSFNGAIACTPNGRFRAIVNTYFALAGAAVITFAVSTFVGKNNKLEMVHIQNATLAGGVAIGTTADLMINPWVALLIGSFAGTVSVLGYKFITPRLNHRIHDTCGVNNLHGMPGIIAGLTGILFAGIANKETYGYELYTIFGARAPAANTTDFANWQRVAIALEDTIEPGPDRSAAAQAGYQCAALAITLGIAIVGGLLIGLLLKIPILRENVTDNLFDDKRFWAVAPEHATPIQVEPNDNNNNNNDVELARLNQRE